MKKKVTLLSAAITAALAAPAFAGINDIFISEYVEGSSNNKAIELTNIGATDFTFTDDIELAQQKDGTDTWYTIEKDNQSALKGVTIPAGQSIVFHNPSSKSTLKSAITNNGGVAIPAGLYHNGNDAIALRNVSDPKSPKILDIVGVENRLSDWGKDLTLRRIKTATSQSATFNYKQWARFKKDTFTGLGDSSLADEPTPPTPCSDGGYEELKIHEIQGAGSRSPFVPEGEYQSDKNYIVKGRISAIGTGLVKGFYLTELEESLDGNPKTSDGLFVSTYAPVFKEMIGEKVCVKGRIKEYYDMTQIKASRDEWETYSDAKVIPTAVDMTVIDDDKNADGTVNFQKTLERHEGMLIKFPQDMDKESTDKETMRVSRTIGFDFDSFRNNMVLAYKRPNLHPNQENPAGSTGSKEQSKQNANYRLYMESDYPSENGVINYYPDFHSDPANNYIRINDSIVNLEGVLTYTYGEYRFIPTMEAKAANFVHNSKRTAKPTLNDKVSHDKFALRIATQNVLNYFNSPFGGAANQKGDNRGADSDAEFRRQHAKIVKAINGLDADIIGLMEIENNGFADYSAISELVDAVNLRYNDKNRDRDNSDYVGNRYAFVGFDTDGNTIIDADDFVGGDVITSGLLYRPSKVTLEYGKIIPMPSQKAPVVRDKNGEPVLKTNKYGEIEVRENGQNYQRDTVAAVFRVNNTGKKLTVAVNHLKSKGSTCWEDWQGWEQWENFDPTKDDVRNGDFQGSCENFRVAAADHLGQEMAKMGGDQVVMGDMNSYANEDPMLVLTSNPTGKSLKAAGYTYIGKMPQFGPNGTTITKSYGFLNTVSIKDQERGHSSWSYSYNDEIGSLDHILITPSLKNKLLDATDWHINAGESKLYDYSEDKKGDNGNVFYAEDPYRSSDHDSAVMALSYDFGETGGEPILLTSNSGLTEVAYPISSTEAKSGDIAEISFSPMPEELQDYGVPRVELDKDGAQTVMFGVTGLTAGNYTVTMQLKRPTDVKSSGSVVPNSTVTMQVEVAKRDSLTPKVTVQPYDGSGGSFGIFGLLSMLGLGFLRRSKK